MLIDWFTVAAQAVNFLVLVGLLRLFLYRRIIDAMDRREERIASRLEEAEVRSAAAARREEEFRRGRERLAEEREEVLRAARLEAEEKRRERLAEAREEIEQARRQWGQALGREKDAFLSELRVRTARESIHLARGILEEMADTTLEAAMVETLVRRLRDLGEEEKAAIVEVLHEDGGRIVVRSAFELPGSAVARLREVLADWQEAARPDEARDGGEEAAAGTLPIDLEIEPELIGGIELEAGGHKIGWSIDDHLGRLEEEFSALLDEESHRLSREAKGARESSGTAGTQPGPEPDPREGDDDGRG